MDYKAMGDKIVEQQSKNENDIMMNMLLKKLFLKCNDPFNNE